MADLRIEVLTSSSCPHCPSAVRATRKLLEDYPELEGRVRWGEVSTNTPDGRHKARRYQVRSVPTIILTNRAGQTGILPGAPTQKKYLEAVYEMLGDAVPPQKKKQSDSGGFLSRFFGR